MFWSREESPGARLEDSPDTVARPAPFRALRHRNFRLFAVGQCISLVGTWMQSVAQSWLVYRLTGSAALLGAVSFTSQIPVLFLSAFGGELADRSDRRKLLLATQASSMVLAGLLAALTLGGVIQIWHVFVLGALLGIVNAFDIPIRQSFLVKMVGKTDLLNAIALNSSMFNGARIVGPAIAGLLVAAIGEGWCFAANALSYVAVIASLTAMRLEVEEKSPRSGSPFEYIAEGFRFAWNTTPIRGLLALVSLVSLVGTPYSVLMPIFADKVLGGGSSALGLLMGSAGLGALFGALGLAMKRGIPGLGRLVATSSFLFGICLLGFSYSRSLYLSALLLIPAGGFLMTQLAATNSLIQAMVPDELRGRVMSIYSMTFMGTAPVGALVVGALGERFGAPACVAAGAVATMASALTFGAYLPELREKAKPLLKAQGMIP